MILSFFLIFLLGAYAAVLGACAWAWRKTPLLEHYQKAPPAFFTVLLPVKDEASNILSLLQDLERQTYPASSFEVIVLDDHSADGTPELIKDFQAASPLNLRLLFLASFPENKLKKGAITLGVSQARGEWIVCTDGDCRVGENWLTALNQARHEQNAKLISGPVLLTTDASWFQKLQALEFSALIGVGAACIGLKKPTMCNGANMAYEKDTFYAVDGFAGTAHIPSGDDEFLMHKVHQEFPGRVAFVKDQMAIVTTNAVATVGAFFAQRIRWASKWKHYSSKMPQALALLVLGANLGLWVALAVCVVGSVSWSLFWAVFLVKIGADALLLVPVLRFFRHPKLLLFIGLLQVVYVPYILMTAVLGWHGAYTWKGRQHTAL